MPPLLPAVAKERGDGSVFMSFGDPAKGPHEQFDFHGSIELAQAIADAYTSFHSPADLEPIPDDSLQAQISEVGNQIHNIGCEHQNNEELSGRLSDAACRLWKISAAIGTPPPSTLVAGDISLREAAQALLDARANGLAHIGYRLDLWRCLESAVAAEARS